MKVLPTDDRVLVKPIEETVTKGGIHLPDKGREKPARGVVVAVGPGRKTDDHPALDWQYASGAREAQTRRRAVALREGQTVVFTRYAGIDLEVEGERLLLMSEGDVLAVLEE